MTGPLAQQFAQVREALPVAAFAKTPDERHEAFEDAAAALSSIERHVQDMEKALWHYAAEANWLRDEDGNEVWDGNHDAARIARDALPASGTRNRVAREKGEE